MMALSISFDLSKVTDKQGILYTQLLWRVATTRYSAKYKAAILMHGLSHLSAIV